MFHKKAIGLAVLFAGAAYGDTCSEIEAQGTIEVARQLNPAYINEQPKYWSTSCASLTPTCIIFPKSAAEVSTILSTLSANSTEPFAVKSGGHNPNNYFSSVAGGPIISTAKLDQANLNQETGVVDVGPGNRLDGIAAKLQGSGWTFVGGRIGNTGVGGLVLGGGLSYMSAQYGWAASSVLEFEVVLANGTIVKASEDSHSDLFVALKGGGNNFGVVTNYRLQARRQGNVWGGNLAFALRSKELDSKMLAAVRDFAEYNTDDKAAVIVTAERANLNAVDSWILFLFYDGPSPPAGLFKNFTDLKPTLNTCRQRTYADMMAFSNWVVVRGSVVDIATETVPIPSREKKEDVMDVLHAHWRNVTSTVLDVPGVIASIAWQPFPRRIAQQARRLGRDLIDADDDADKFIVEMNYSFIPQSQYERMADTMERTYSGVRERVLAWIADGTLPDAYLPVFMNYGFFRQDYFGRLKASSRALARSVAERYDPDGLFRERTGGWKP